MSRRGFALVTVLWVVAALSAAVGVSLSMARVGGQTSRNRILLTRGGWAREACLEILLARYAQDPATRAVDTLDLGRGTWCRAEVSDPTARLDLNLASTEAIRRLVGNDTLADALLDWRDPDDIPRPLGAEAEWYRQAGRRLPRNGPLAAVEELSFVRGFGGRQTRRLQDLVTVEGTGEINLNTAPPEVLATLPGVGPEALAAMVARRSAGEQLKDMDQLLSLLSPPARSAMLDRHQEFTRVATYTAPRLVASVEGGVRGSVPMSRARVTLIPVGRRLAVVRRITE